MTSSSSLYVAHPRGRCPDCPGTRQSVFDALVSAADGCRLRCTSLDARDPIPDSWFGEGRLLLVRRGVIIRERLDPRGGVVAVDAVGPGCLLPLPDDPRVTPDSAPCGYAATGARVCVAGSDVVERALRAEPAVAHDLLRMQCEAMVRLERLADARGRSSSRARVAALFCALADTLSPPVQRDRIPAGVQQRDLAHMLGMRHETLCRVIGALERIGGVERSPNGIRIADRSLLEEG